jgi:hypothetical protein
VEAAEGASEAAAEARAAAPPRAARAAPPAKPAPAPTPEPTARLKNLQQTKEKEDNKKLQEENKKLADQLQKVEREKQQLKEAQKAKGGRRASQEQKPAKTNAQRRQEKVCVETNHKDRNIISFDAVRKTDCISPAGCPPITTQLILFDEIIFLRWYLTLLWYWQETEAAAADARPNLHSKLNAQTFSRKITRACVPLMVARIGHNWDAAGVASLVTPIVQTMVVAHNIASIQDYEEYDALRDNRSAVERVLLQGFQETNNRGAKAFRDKARELIMPFFVKGDGTKQQDEKFIHAMLSTFRFTISTVFHHDHPAGHPMLLECMATPPPTEKGELRSPRTLAAARARVAARRAAMSPSSATAIQFIHPVGCPTVVRRVDVRPVITYLYHDLQCIFARGPLLYVFSTAFSTCLGYDGNDPCHKEIRALLGELAASFLLLTVNLHNIECRYRTSRYRKDSISTFRIRYQCCYDDIEVVTSSSIF